MTHSNNPWIQELQSIGRSFMRAMIFGVAFLYTMEMWWVGAWLPYQRLMIFFGVAFLVDLYLLPLTESTKQDHPLGWVIRTTIRNKGLAILVAAIILFILGEVSPFSASYERDLSIILLLSIPIGIGFNIARILEIYRTPGRSGKGDKEGTRFSSSKRWSGGGLLRATKRRGANKQGRGGGRRRRR